MLSPVIRPTRRNVALVALVLALCFGVPRPAAADSAFFERDRGDLSIYRIWPWIDGAIIVGSNAVTLGFYAFGSGLVHPSCPCDPNSVNAFDRLAIGNHSDTAYNLATVAVGLTILVPIALDVWDLRRFWPVLEDVIVLGEALSLSGAFDSLAKFTVGRPFPRTYAGDPSLLHDSSGYRSFYSGHTTLAFTALSVASMTIGRRHHEYAIPWIATVLVGSSVAAGVVLAGWHFPTDTIAGAVFGTAIGVTVPLLHFTEAPVTPMLSLTPDHSGPLLSLGGWF